MKCHKPNTDQEAVLTVSANGFPCPEYISPSSSTSDPNVLECFIPVSDGDQLTLDGHFSGTVLHGSIDLVADGAFLRDRRIEGSKLGEVKYTNKRRLDFQAVLDSPKPPGWTSIYPSKTVAEGNMHVVALDEQPGELSGDKLGVGSLAVIISVNQKSTENYHDQYPSLRCGDWSERDLDEMRDGGVGPTHEIEIKVTDDNVHKNKQSKHRRHYEQTRFGLKPWAKFVFYYRSHMSIESAGCIPRSDKIQELEPSDPKKFVRASADRKGTKKKDSKKVDAEKEEEDYGEDIVVAPARKNGVSSSPPLTSTEMIKTKSSLGRTLLNPNGRDSLFVSESPTPGDSNMVSGSAMSQPKGSSSQEDDEEDSSEESDDAETPTNDVQDIRLRTAKLDEDSVSASAEDKADGDLSTTIASDNVYDRQDDTVAGDEEALNVAEEDGAAAERPSMKALVQAAEKYARIASPKVRVKEGPLEERTATTTSSTFQHASQRTEEVVSPQLAAQSDNAVTSTASDLNVGASDQGSTGHTNDDNETEASAVQRNAVKIKLEPTDQVQQPATATPSISSMPASSPRFEGSSYPLLKRTGSNSSMSREGTPNKKPRVTDLQARKASLAAQLEKKRQLKLAEQQNLEEQQRLREQRDREQEDALEREIEMLERQNAEEDEELKAVRRATEQEQAEMEMEM